MTGTPLLAVKRMQFNLPLAPNPKITLMKTLPVSLHPIFWLEEVSSHGTSIIIKENKTVLN